MIKRNRKISRRELCLVMGIGASVLRKYISRGSIKEISRNQIDIDNEENKACITLYASKKGMNIEKTLYAEGVQDKSTPEAHIETKTRSRSRSRSRIKADSKNKKNFEGEAKLDSKGMSEVELKKSKIVREVAKLEVETKLKRLELEKKKAQVLPLDFVIKWSSLNITGIFGETVNFGNSIIEQLCNDLDAETEMKLKYKKQFKQGFNELLQEGIKNQKPEAIEQAREYSLLTKW